MPATVTILESADVDLRQEVLGTVGLDSSYPPGGEPLTAANFRMRLGNLNDVQAQPTGRFVFEWDQANKKLIVKETPVDYVALSTGGLAIGSGSKKEVLIANTVNFLAAGLFKAKTTAEVGFTATTHDITANASTVQERVYAVSLQADGTPIITAGTVATGAGNAAVPDVPEAETFIGTVRVAVDVGSTDFDATSDDLDAAHLTVAYVDATEAGLREVRSGTDLSAVTTRVLARGR